MRSDVKEVENILQRGKEILEKRSELYNLTLDEVLDEFEDDTEDMRSYRWGVTAQIVVNSIQDWNLRTLVEYLPNIKSGLLTCEYAGYLLLKEYHVNLEDLIIEAQKCNLFDKIVKYVCANIKFIAKPQRFIDVLEVLEIHSEHSDYNTFLSNYAQAIAASNIFLEVEKELREIKNQTQYNIMRKLSRDWFIQDITSASGFIEHLIAYNSVWSKKTAIHFWNIGISFDKSMFSQYFSRFEDLLQEDDEFWILIIPVFINYLTIANGEDKTTDCYSKAIDLLKKIPNDTIEIRREFLRAIIFQKDISEDVKIILNDMLSTPFDQDNQMVDLMDYRLSLQIKNGEVIATVQQMLSIFSVNKYRLNYYKFFKYLDSTVSELSNYSIETTEIALSYMLTNNIDKILFGLGLLIETGDILKFKESKFLSTEDCKPYTEQEIIQLMEIVSLLSFDCNRICNFAFQLLEIFDDNYDKYFEFCINEVYYNFPFTMQKISEKYKASENKVQSLLANKVIELHQTISEEQNIARKIKDLQPPLEHVMIINKALYKQNEQINKAVREQSVLADIFHTQHLKYGVNVGFIYRMAKKERAYSASPLQHIYQEREISAFNNIDPVQYELKRRAYLSKVEGNETDN